MGCTPLKKTRVVPMMEITETTRIVKRKKKIMLSTDAHINHLNLVNEIRPESLIIEEPYLKETVDRKFREYADLLENPQMDLIPKEKYIAF